MILNSVYLSPLSYQERLRNYWPLSVETIQTIKDIALGVFAFIVELPLLDLAERKICEWMRHLNLDISKPQDIILIWNAGNNLPHQFLILAYKTAWLSYIVIFGPILEEQVFRNWLQTTQKEWSHDPTTLKSRISRVVTNALIFGAAHLSTFQGWTNVPIFVVTSLLGGVFATLREITGNIKASSTAHILHNGTVMFFLIRSSQQT